MKQEAESRKTCINLNSIRMAYCSNDIDEYKIK